MNGILAENTSVFFRGNPFLFSSSQQAVTHIQVRYESDLDKGNKLSLTINPLHR